MSHLNIEQSMLPDPCSDSDKAAYESILSVPWLKSSICPTGSKWGRRIADVTLSRLPQNLLGQVMVIPSNPEDPNSSPLQDEVVLVIFRWDRDHQKGWSKAFSAVLTFPDGSSYEVEVPSSLRLVDGHSFHIPVNPETTLVREKKLQDNRVIPRIIFNLSAPLHKQGSQEARSLLENIRITSNLIHCTSLYLVMEDEACLKEVENSGVPNFIEAYNLLRSGSYKADLMRYYLLYKYGGVYLDNKSCLRYSIDSDTFDNLFSDTNSTEQCQMFIGYRTFYEIAFMGTRRGSPIMLRALECAISNIMKREYGSDTFSITGNTMLGKILNENTEKITQPSSSFKETWLKYFGEKIAVLPIGRGNENIFHLDSIVWNRQAIPYADWPKPSTYYHNVWLEGNVYMDIQESHTFRGQCALYYKKIIAYTSCFLVLFLVGFIISRYPPISWI